MPVYHPPLQEMRFLLGHVLCGSLDGGIEGLDATTLSAILDEAAAFATGVLAPLNETGDREGTRRREDGTVDAAKGFREAYRAFRENGWNGVSGDPLFGGQGLPWSLAFAVQEMWQSANMAFGLCPLLNQGAVHALELHGSEDLRKTFLPKLVSGEWTGTMNLTEPQAGSDLGSIVTRADPRPDGSHALFGQKIFITWGEHDLTENIVHLVLARTPDAPEGVKGLSLFLVPKILPESGERNDVRCVSLEHKLGIHASPTCTMVFGDSGQGATGWLVGGLHQGLSCMFSMMNNARLSVGLQGVAMAERALQAARAYAAERVQGGVAISEYPDVRRMLLTIEAKTQAARALAYDTGRSLDLAKAGDETEGRKAGLLTPVVKAWATDLSVEAASLAIQIHGGAGYVEESGVSQFYRDARILPIYEGTNGIQAMDLVFRKILKDAGVTVEQYLQEIELSFEAVRVLPASHTLSEVSRLVSQGLISLRKATDRLLRRPQDRDALAFIAAPYLELFGLVAGGAMHLRCLIALADMERSGTLDEAFAKGREETALFYVETLLPHAVALCDVVCKPHR